MRAGGRLAAGWCAALLLVATVAAAQNAAAGPRFPMAALFAEYWSAEDVVERLRVVERLIEADADFETLVEHLRRGRPYAGEVPLGVLAARHGTADGLEHHYAYVVPDDYDPGSPIGVRFMLHGGVSTDRRDMGGRGPLDRLRRLPYITVLPSAWRQAKWWHETQIENLVGILGDLKRTYNIDENRVHLGGISDGASGLYYVAMKEPTPWAGYLSFIGSVAVLRSAADREGQLHPTNLLGKPFFVVNTGRDPLYPDSRVAPWMEMLRRAGVDVTYRVKPEFGHDTNWWPEERSRIEAFTVEHPRQALPEELDWSSERVDRYARQHWLVLEELGEASGEGSLADFNLRDGKALFPTPLPFGRVRLRKEGNRVTVRTSGVRRYRLLLSPDAFDLEAPILVTTNGAISFSGRVEKSRRTLLEWAARDDDRTMLFGAELVIELTPNGGD